MNNMVAITLEKAFILEEQSSICEKQMPNEKTQILAALMLS
jgi:hypothetical protein